MKNLVPIIIALFDYKKDSSNNLLWKNFLQSIIKSNKLKNLANALLLTKIYIKSSKILCKFIFLILPK